MDVPTLRARLAERWSTLPPKGKVGVYIGAFLVFLGLATALRGCRPLTDHTDFTVEQLIAQGEKALAALPDPANQRKRRPVFFDDLLRPVDMLLAKSKDALNAAAEASRDATDRSAQEKHFSLALRSAEAARDLASRGQDLAFELSDRPFRFPAQRAEAARYVTTVLWARFQQRYAEYLQYDPDYQPDNPRELTLILREIDAGLAASQRDKELLYLQGRVRYQLADFTGAAESFRRVIETDTQFGPAYAGLGNALTMQGDFDAAERAFTDQVVVGERDARTEQGDEVLRSGLFNLARFHDLRASAFEGGTDGETGTRADEHRRKAVAFYRRFLSAAATVDDPDIPTARDRLSLLSREK